MPENDLTVWWKNIAILQRKNGLTQKELAQRLGVSRLSLKKLEKGEASSYVFTKVVFRIYTQFGVAPDRQFEEWEE